MEQDATEKLALIDVGSNTIRTVVYGRRGNRARKLYSERDYTGLIAYVSNGRLTEEGVAKLCATMAHMKRFCALCRCESVTAFSTASLRGITNRAETVEAVRKLTGIDIVPLTAEEEMACDCAALKRTGLKEGFAFDLGGGSCQVFRFGENGLGEGASLPFGCLTLGEHFVRRGLFPDREEARAMRRYVRGTLDEYLPGFVGVKPPVIHAMGGTARAVAKVLRASGQAEQDGDCLCIPREALRDLLRDARKNEGKMVALLRRVIPGRMSTLLPGILAMETIARHLECETIEVTPTGVREGFLWTKLLPTAAPSTAN